MKSFKISIVFIAFMCLFATSNLQAWDTFSYESTVDSLIPPEGNPGIWDTISVPVDIIIEDLNVYVEIETFSYIAGSLGNTLTSPWQDTVTICYRNGDRVLPLWFDTDDDEDGPGDLDDYNGLNACGKLLMKAAYNNENFDWHMINMYSDYALDAVYGKYLQWNDYKTDAFRYYWNQNCVASEPPRENPAVLDYTSSVFPNKPWVNDVDAYRSLCLHITQYNLGSGQLPFMLFDFEEWIMNSFRLKALGLSSYIIDPLENCSSDEINSFIRTSNLDNPGYYFRFPGSGSSSTEDIELNDTNILFFRKIESNYINSYYHNESIIDSLNCFHMFDNIRKNLLTASKYKGYNIIDSTESHYKIDLKRNEFFFDIESNGTAFRFSGWYGKFAHIYTITEFDSKKGFIKEAQKYFNLPDLDLNKVSYIEGEDGITGCYDYFYSYDDPDAGFKLYAYPFITSNNCEEDSGDKYHDGVILDLTVYAEEE